MADLTFDAVICGGGNKALMLAMYLSKYAGMSVGIFERDTRSAGPGHRRDLGPRIPWQHPRQHNAAWYYAPLWRDFPEFWSTAAA